MRRPSRCSSMGRRRQIQAQAIVANNGEESAAHSAPNPWLQAGGIAFLALYAVSILAALGWLFSNLHQISPQNRAIVSRFGAFNRVHGAGLLLAWPRPFEEVTLLPSSETIVEQDIQVEQPQPGAASSQSAGGDDESSGGAGTMLGEGVARLG